MAAFTKATVSCVVALWLGALFVSNALAQTGYAINSPNTAISGATTSDSVQINITAPSTALILRSTLNLNGKNVTWALQPNGTGSMSGTVSG